MWKSAFRAAAPLRQCSALLIAESSLQQQLRTTFVLRRLIPPRLHKRGMQPKPLRYQNYIYELVKDTNIEKQPDVNVVLTTFVSGVGNAGDLVSVRPNYAYNELLIPGLAVYATPENVEKLKATEKKEEVFYSSTKVPAMMDMLQRITLSIILNKDSPWTLQKWHIRASFRKCGFVVPEYAITMPAKEIRGPDLGIEGKVFPILVTINKTEQVKVKCRIHHWSTNIMERIPHEDDFWKKEPEYLFSEEPELKTS